MITPAWKNSGRVKNRLLLYKKTLCCQENIRIFFSEIAGMITVKMQKKVVPTCVHGNYIGRIVASWD